MSPLFEVREGTKAVGSFSARLVRQLAEDGTLHAGMEIRRLPDGAWAPLSNVKGLQFKPPLTSYAPAVAASPRIAALAVPPAKSPPMPRGPSNPAPRPSKKLTGLSLAGALIFSTSLLCIGFWAGQRNNNEPTLEMPPAADFTWRAGRNQELERQLNDLRDRWRPIKAQENVRNYFGEAQNAGQINPFCYAAYCIYCDAGEDEKIDYADTPGTLRIPMEPVR